MLSDFPKVKEKVIKTLYKRLQTHAIPEPFQKAKHLSYHEGNRHRIIRSDGSVTENEFMEATGTITLDLLQCDSISLEEVIAKVDVAVEEMKSQMAQHFFDEISKSVDEVGNTINAKGNSFTAEMYLAALEKVQLDFFGDGTPHELTLVCSPKMAPRMKAELQRLHTEPELERQHRELIRKKREEWRERENSRKLVG